MKRCLAPILIIAVLASCDAADGTTGLFGTSPGTGSSTKLGFTVQPTTVAAGASIIPAVSVAVQNASGATITTATNSVTMSLTSGTGTNGAVLGGTRTVNAVNGIATFPGLTVDRSGVGFTLTASGSNLTSASSSTFSVNP
jgi:hypothetical protein